MKKIGVFIILVMLFIPKVYAATYLTTNKTKVSPNDTFEITVSFNNVVSWDINVSSTENARNCTISEKDNSDTSTNKIFKTTCRAVGTGVVTVSLSGSITPANNELDNEEDDEENEEITLNESVEIEIEETGEEVPSTGPKGLASLTVTDGTLYPAFDDTLNSGYRIVLNMTDTSTFSIMAVAKEPEDSVTIKRETNGTYEVVDPENIEFKTSGGNNTMLLEISVGTGSRLVKYNIIVSKPQIEDIKDPELATLKVGNKEVTLMSGVYEYTVELADEDLEEDGSYKVTALLADEENYEFNKFNGTASGTNFAIEINPKSFTEGLKSATYIITVKGSVIDPNVSQSGKTTKKPGGNGGGNSGGNPGTGSRTSYIVGVILILSVIASLYLYKKNINGYN